MITRDTKQGTKCVVIANNSRHNRPMGSIITINTFYNNGGQNDGFTSKEHGHTYFSMNDLRLWKQNMKDLEEELFDLTSKVKDTESKIIYLKETGEKDIDVDDYKTYKLNNIITDDELSSEEKTQLILNLMGEGKKKKVKIVSKKKLKDVPENEEVEEMESEADFEEGAPADQGFYHNEYLDDVGKECTEGEVPF
ncbi:MAG: hypothetical protein SLAVMIC_00430 [uncultured marine phage]|uniref:Uncharacterized protein n=1 Tax=uncultured marine phage TaxID=707152 RepID=A0A8D9CBI6_9VIRU|nr:MAG: hypothetical protein SLAVMIC_00430 [uncultured marine phage]